VLISLDLIYFEYMGIESWIKRKTEGAGKLAKAGVVAVTLLAATEQGMAQAPRTQGSMKPDNSVNVNGHTVNGAIIVGGTNNRVEITGTSKPTSQNKDEAEIEAAFKRLEQAKHSGQQQNNNASSSKGNVVIVNGKVVPPDANGNIIIR